MVVKVLKSIFFIILMIFAVMLYRSKQKNEIAFDIKTHYKALINLETQRNALYQKWCATLNKTCPNIELTEALHSETNLNGLKQNIEKRSSQISLLIAPAREQKLNIYELELLEKKIDDELRLLETRNKP